MLLCFFHDSFDERAALWAPDIYGGAFVYEVHCDMN